MLTYTSLKDKPKEFLSATGLSDAEFQRLLPVFAGLLQAAHAQQTMEGQPRQRQPGGGRSGSLRLPADKLLFILVYQKTYPLQTMQGLQFGLSQAQSHYWIQRLLPFLQRTLTELGLEPARDAQQLSHSESLQQTPADLLLDGTERRIQRPQDAEEQTAHYSGKKKTHTDKNLVLVNASTDQVIYLGPTTEGKTHDKKAADEAAIVYPRGSSLGKDTGFQGYEPPGVVTFQPKKKPTGQPRAESDKLLNRILSGVRIAVEHVIAGVKRCRIVKDTLRNTKQGFSDLVMEVACGLHNLRTAARHPQPTFALANFVCEIYSQ
jgi:hypothetical protein